MKYLKYNLIKMNSPDRIAFIPIRYGGMNVKADMEFENKLRKNIEKFISEYVETGMILIHNHSLVDETGDKIIMSSLDYIKSRLNMYSIKIVYSTMLTSTIIRLYTLSEARSNSDRQMAYRTFFESFGYDLYTCGIIDVYNENLIRG